MTSGKAAAWLLMKKMSGDVSLAADVTFPNPNGTTNRKAIQVIRRNLDDDSKEAMIAGYRTGMIHLGQRPEKGLSSPTCNTVLEGHRPRFWPGA
jgi:hypothetical protein